MPAPVQELSLRQLAGQRIVYSYTGVRPPRRLLARIRAGEAAGVIFYRSNIAGRAQLRRVVARLQRAAARSPVEAPLLLMVDQEGGLVRRLGGPPLLSARRIGAAADPAALARRAGRGAGLNLRAAGLNVNLAPVLDVYRSPVGFIGRFGRSFSRDPQVVAQLGAGFITEQQRIGVAATAKHFPGLGTASRRQDSDARPVTLRVPLATLRAVDEAPYPAAVAAGARLVMVSWATYPALDARRPAGLSSTVIQEELRERLGFAGVTITDDLGAGALRGFGGIPRRAVLAAEAGADLLLCAGQRMDRGGVALKAVEAAMRSGRLERSACEESVARVIALRSSLAE